MSNYLNTLSHIVVTSPSTVYAKATEVTFSGVCSGSNLSALNIEYQEIWQFGDEEYSYNHSPTHIFKNKGVYPVTYSVLIPGYDGNDEVRTLTTNVSVYNYVEDDIKWVQTPPGTYQSVKQSVPFIISISSSNIDDIVIPTVNLYSRGSKSQPWQIPQHKWSHLKPQWRFTDIQGNVTYSISASDYEVVSIDGLGNRVYDNTGTIVGVRADVGFYYIDDLPSLNLDNSSSPITLVATLEVSGYGENNEASYANSTITKECVHTIKPLTPDHLKVTANGITPISDVIWTGAYTPYVVTVHPSAPYDYIILRNFPQENFSISTYTQNLSNVPLSDVEFDTNIDITRYDNDGFDVGGYFRGAFRSSASTENATLNVTGEVAFDVLKEPFGAWVSNPSFNDLVYLTIKDMQTTQEFVSSVYKIDDSKIYGIARVAKDVDDTSWCTDPENNKIYKVSRSVGIDKVIDLTTYPECSSFMEYNGFGVTPTGVVLDSSKNVWVTLFDAGSTIKINPNTGNIVNMIFPPISSVYVPDLSIYGGDYTVRPTKVDIDCEDNVWIAYNHPLNSFICKYLYNGSHLFNINLPQNSQPYDLIIDRADNVWVTLSNESTGTNGSVVKYDTLGNVLSSFSGFRLPTYATLDFHQNLWFINSYNTITKIDNDTGSVTNYVMTSTSLSVDPITDVVINDRLYDQELGGISCDWFNRIWVLNSYDNKVYMVDANSPENRKEIQIAPYSNNFTYSLQAYGDWHGVQWYNKYEQSAPLSSIGGEAAMRLTGSSNIFSIRDFSSSYNVRKQNEDFDGVNKIRNITLQDNIHRNDSLFGDIISPVMGSYDGDPLTPGTVIYEKISNFINNHGDIDECNIDQLKSLLSMIDIPVDNYDVNYPADIKRLIDLLSISINRLKPTNNGNSRDFKKYNELSSGRNIGKLIDVNTYIATAGENIIVNTKYSNYYEKIEITPVLSSVLLSPELSGAYKDEPLESFPLSSFPLSGYTGWGLDVPVYNYYNFYQYLSGTEDTQVEGVIDWNNANTTLNPNISSVDEWYKDGGIVDLIYNYYIFKGLGLIKE